MAYETGTLTDFNDLITKFKTFVTTDATLTTDGQLWTVLKDSDVDTGFADDALCTGANATAASTGPFIRRVYFKSEGLGGTDSIYHCMTSLKTAAGAYNLELRNHQTFNSAVTATSQLGISPAHYLLLNNAASVNTYWFIVNGRRAIIIVKIGSVYECGYIGLGHSCGSPSEVPYPYMTGGACSTYSLTPSSTAAEHRAFFAPYYVGATIGSAATLTVLIPNTTNWLPVGNYSFTSTTQTSPGTTVVMPLFTLAGNGVVAFSTSIQAQGYCYGNTDRVIRPISIVSSLTGYVGSYGALDGVFHVSGEGMASEYTLTIGGDTYLCIQSTFYTNRESFAAFKLE